MFLTIEQAQERDDAAALRLIPTSQKPDVETMFAKLARRCFARNLTAAPRLEWIADGTYRHSWNGYDNEGRRVTKSRNLPGAWVKVVGDAPKIAGWSLAARLQRLATGERMLRVVPGLDDLPDRFRDTGYICEHCNRDRARKDCFVVMSDAGEFKQVGASCLKDFLGHEPMKFIQFFKGYGAMMDEWTAAGWGNAMSFPNVEDTLEVLHYACAAIRVEGWVSSKAATETGAPSTRLVVGQCIRPTTDHDHALRRKLTPTEADWKLAADVLAWVRRMDAGSNDYMQNLKIALAHDVIDPRTYGVAVSGPSAYLRAMSREQELRRERAEQPASEWRGEVGKRLRDMAATVESVRPMESDFGSLVMVKFRGNNGDLMTWFTGSFEGQPGDEVVLTGTVKRHAEYKGLRETHLSRCKVA